MTISTTLKNIVYSFACTRQPLSWNYSFEEKLKASKFSLQFTENCNELVIKPIIFKKLPFANWEMIIDNCN